ncbi:hypothetical protein SDC9_200431 [bioreactor metagenome]|uniref:Uncharacterized protein n=1 Tax=bioreactor metagenome TaxID=1076179 RepID=A0A645IN72_9ZZZZ
MDAQQFEPAAEEQPVRGADAADAVLRKQTDKQGAEHTVHEMHRQRADRVVKFDTVKEHDRQHDKNSGN